MNKYNNILKPFHDRGWEKNNRFVIHCRNGVLYALIFHNNDTFNMYRKGKGESWKLNKKYTIDEGREEWDNIFYPKGYVEEIEDEVDMAKRHNEEASRDNYNSLTDANKY